jgi:hypothetical protein
VHAVENKYYAAARHEAVSGGRRAHGDQRAFDELFKAIQTKETDRGTAMFRRGTGEGMLETAVRQALGPAIEKTRVPIRVVQSVKDLPFDAPADAKGAYYQGRIWAVADNISSAHDAESTILRHEITHAGIDALYGSRDARATALKDLQSKNPNLHRAADGWYGRYGEETAAEYVKRGASQAEAERMARLDAIEEGLAHGAQDLGNTLNGWKAFVATIQKSLRALGLHELANHLEKASNAEVLSFLDMARRATEERKQGLGQTAPAFHRAYHGGPHDFDRFDIAKIGTGEGAQAYGHGLYFAGRKEVAEYYKRALSQPRDTYDGQPLDHGNSLAARIWHSAGRPSAMPNGKYPSPPLEEAKREIVKQARENLDVAQRNLRSIEKSTQLRAEIRAQGIDHKDAYLASTEKEHNDRLGYYTGQVKVAREELAKAEAFDLSKYAYDKRPGRLYEVELAPKEQDYLDWDKPLSEQSERVTRGAENVIDALVNEETDYHKASALSREYEDWMKLTGAAFYHKVVVRQGGGPDSPEMASRLLSSAGIPGIKYLDGSSRTRLSYSGDPAYLAAAHDFKLAGKSAHEALDGMRDAYRNASVADLSAAINEAYDQKPQNHNYVIFDDKHVNVVAKYARKDGKDLALTGETEAEIRAREAREKAVAAEKANDLHAPGQARRHEARGGGDRARVAKKQLPTRSTRTCRRSSSTAARRSGVEDFLDRRAEAAPQGHGDAGREDGRLRGVAARAPRRGAQRADREDQPAAAGRRLGHDERGCAAVLAGPRIRHGAGPRGAREAVDAINAARGSCWSPTASRRPRRCRRGNRVQHYVPLQREDMETGMGIGPGLQRPRQRTKRATGSTRRGRHPRQHRHAARARHRPRREEPRGPRAPGPRQGEPESRLLARRQPPTVRAWIRARAWSTHVDPLYKSRDNVIVVRTCRTRTATWSSTPSSSTSTIRARCAWRMA